MTDVRAPATGPLRDIWTRIAVDPIAEPLGRRLARHRVVTPNRVTGVAIGFAVLAAACFATGHLHLGAAFYLARFFSDCLDGQVARLQGTGSRRGAALDLAADIGGIAVVLAALTSFLSREGHAPYGVGVGLLAAIVFYNWALAYRKDLARQASLGDGGAQRRWDTELPVLRGWVRLTNRWGMSPLPWAVEMEIVMLALSPLFLPVELLVYPLGAGLVFYVMADAVNMRRIWRTAALLERLDSARDEKAAVMPSEEQLSPLPCVDVVVATHHRPELLRVALDAIWAQDYAGQITCYVVFDQAEPDETLVRTEDRRAVRVLSNDRRPGLAGARNSGIVAGRGELVAFCDDDDQWLPSKLTRQVAALAGSEAPTSVTGITVSYGDRAVDRVPEAGTMTLANLVRSRVMEAHPSTVVVRREELLRTIGLVDEDIPGSYGEDFDWIIRAAQAGGFAVVEEPLVKVRWGQSLFSQRWETIVDSIDYGLAKHAVFHRDRYALARLYGRRAFALAALGRRGEALRTAARAARQSPRERRAYLATAVALGLVSAERLMNLAHTRGHGI